MTDTLIDRLSKAKTAEDAEAILREVRESRDSRSEELHKIALRYNSGDGKAHGEFHRALLRNHEASLVLEALDDPERSLLWHFGNILISQHKEGESEYAKLLRLESDVIQLTHAIGLLFVLIRQPEILKAVAHLMEADEETADD